MRSFFGGLFGLFLLFSSSTFAQKAPSPPLTQLPAPVVAVMQKYKLPDTGLSVFVQSVTNKQALLLFNADIPRNPASAIKLLTTYAGLELLGPAYTWKTEAYLGGALNQGILQGDLILKGHGDPFLTTDKFWKMLSDLRTKGLRHINGNLLIDNSYFAPLNIDPGAFDKRPDRAYNAVPSALMVNFQVIGLNFFPESGVGKVRIALDPAADNIIVQNNLKLIRGRCNQRQIKFNTVSNKQNQGINLTVNGNYPASCGEFTMHRVILPTEQQVFGVFQALWRDLGGSFKGQLRTGKISTKQKPFYVFRSSPLAELIRGMNKYSNNVMTRQLLLTLAAEKLGAPGSLEKGRAVIKQWLQSKGLNFPELLIDNGAGLSRSTRISARSMGNLLLNAHHSLYLPELKSSLPLAALDGTLRRRFRGEALASRVRLKTGTINNVKAIAGYVLAQSGTTYAVVALHNHPGVHQGTGTEVQNALLRWVFTQ